MNSKKSPRLDWSEVIAVFGGSFDPPHRGHREAVAGLFRNPGVREVWVIPSATPPDKPARVSAEGRLKLAQLNFMALDPECPIPGPVRVDDRELVRATKTGTPSFSFDTLSQIQTEVRSLAMVIGADRLPTLPRWHRFPELLNLCHWIVLDRKSQESTSPRDTLRQWESSGLIRSMNTGPRSDSRWTLQGSPHVIEIVETPARELSSTAIRQAIALTGKPPAGALTAEVSDYLKRERLYGTEPQ